MAMATLFVAIHVATTMYMPDDDWDEDFHSSTTLVDAEVARKRGGAYQCSVILWDKNGKRLWLGKLNAGCEKSKRGDCSGLHVSLILRGQMYAHMS